MKEKFFTCDCINEGLLVTTDLEDGEMYFALFTHRPVKPNLLTRIRMAWGVIKTGEVFADQIILKYDKARGLADHLNSECDEIMEYANEKT